jgi:signal transduction histidine kinase
VKSLQNRLQIGLLTSLFIAMTFIWWLANTSISHIAHHMMQTRLEHDGDSLLASLKPLPNGNLGFEEMQLGPVYEWVYSGHYYVIKSGNQELRSHSLWDQTLNQPVMETGLVQVETVSGPDGQKLLQWTSQFKRFNQRITITVAEDINDLLTALHTFNVYFALASGLLLVSLALIQSFIVKRSLRSLSTINDELQALSGGEIKALSKQVPSEIHPLIDKVNQLLQLLREQLKRSRNATGNLAHGLKHPLNLLMQLAGSDEVKLDKSVREELKSNIREINQLMEKELKRAKLVGSGVPGQLFSAREEVTGLIDVLERVYHNKSLSLTVDISQNIDFRADRNDMLELLGNLLDNAFKWATSKVSCKLYQQHGLHIQIEDDGPGCNSEQLTMLTTRGIRVDETTAGTGLGLAIVKDVVELYSGSISFKRSTLGGLCVRVELPPLSLT